MCVNKQIPNKGKRNFIPALCGSIHTNYLKTLKLVKRLKELRNVLNSISNIVSFLGTRFD